MRKISYAYIIMIKNGPDPLFLINSAAVYIALIVAMLILLFSILATMKVHDFFNSKKITITDK